MGELEGIQRKNEGRIRLVVIGNGMAGVASIEEIIKHRSDLSITLFGGEPHVNYNRILLSDVLAGKCSKEKIILNPLEWYRKNKIDLRLGNPVKQIDPVSKTVLDSKGEVSPFDKLLIAVGGKPVRPPVQGIGKKGVFLYRNLQDAEVLLKQVPTAQRAVVIGGGLLGLEAARALVQHGLAVTVVHLMGHLMEQQLDAIAGAILKREIERLGIGVRLNTTAEAILGEESVNGVRLRGGGELPADLVLMCTGIRPDLDLANAAGLRTNRGILVDDEMQTSCRDIYAVGDAIEHRGKTYGLVAPLIEQARVVADQLAGQRKLRYEGTVCPTVLKVAGIQLTSAGFFQEGPGRETLVYIDTQAAVYKKLVLEGPRLSGMILLGDHPEGPRLFQLIKSAEDISSKKKELYEALYPLAPSSGEDRLSPVARMAESELVCNCHSVTKGTIVTAIRSKKLKTREEIAAETQATTGCGSCSQLVDDLLGWTEKPEPVGTVREKKAPVPSNDPVLNDKPILGYPDVYPKSLDIEKIKQEGLGLDFEKIREKGVMALTEDDYYRLKTYGICSQKHPGYFMVRIRIPGGRLTADQLYGLADLAEVHGRGRAHISTRQNLELHWVRVEEIPDLWEKLEGIGLSTRSACGHTLRNVTACPHGAISEEGVMDVWPLAKAVSDYFIERSDLINPAMPNRINIFFAGCTSCAGDARINDIGFVGTRRPGGEGFPDELGFELWAGGSLGAHPMLGHRLKTFIPDQDTLAACQAIFYLHTKFGNRNKAKSRLKWLIQQWGIEKFTRAFERVFEGKRTLPENKNFVQKAINQYGNSSPLFKKMGSRLTLIPSPQTLPSGFHPQKQRGFLWVRLGAPLGEFRADQLRALAKISKRYARGEAHFMPDQDVEMHWIRADHVRRVSRILKSEGFHLNGRKAGVKLLACPGTAFCVLAVTNAQGAARELLRHYRPADPAKEGLLNEISIHISGCPNSCARHQTADIGLAGTLSTQEDGSRFSYMLFLGGGTENGVRLGEMVRKGITEDRVVPEIDGLLDVILKHREPGETFQQTVLRMGHRKIGDLLNEKMAPHFTETFKPVLMEPDFAEV